MITLDQALTANEFLHTQERNAGGTPVRARRTGKTQTWKTKPHLFRIPVKYGLITSFYIQNFNDTDLDAPAGGYLNVYPGASSGRYTRRPAAQGRNDHLWCIPERWEAEHQLFQGVTP